jgi:outer membrane protein TolC
MTTRRSSAALSLAVGMTLCACAARAQISLSTAEGLALRNDPRVKAAQADVAKAQASLQEAHDAFVPTLGVGGGYGKSTGPPLGLPTVFSVSSQSLVFNFSQKDTIRAAAAGVESAKLSLKEAQQQVEEDVATTYVSLNSAEARKAAMLDEQGYATRLVTIVSERVDAGLDAQVDLLRAKRTAAQIHLLELREEDDIAALQDHLARAIGLPGTELGTVPSSIPAMPDLHTLKNDGSVSFGVQAAFEGARSERESAFGESRYLYRPQVSLVGNYSRLNTSPSESNFLIYYPTFAGKSNNDAAIALQIQIPLLDRQREAKAKELTAEANHAQFQAETQKNQFLEGRAKLRRSVAELQVRSEVAGFDRDIAKEQLNAVLAQLSADSASSSSVQMTPKDEQNARLGERQRYVDYLTAQQELEQDEISLLRQTGQLEAWLQTATDGAPAVNGTAAHP